MNALKGCPFYLGGNMRQGMCMVVLLLAGCIQSALAIEVTEKKCMRLRCRLKWSIVLLH